MMCYNCSKSLVIKDFYCLKNLDGNSRYPKFKILPLYHKCGLRNLPLLSRSYLKLKARKDE